MEDKTEEILQKGSEEGLDPVVEELKAAKDQLLRLAAEFDNFRKRSLKERDEIAVRAKCEALKAFLPVMDNFERAAATLQDDSPSAQGLQMIYEQFAAVLAAQGAECFGAAGDAFDPALHHAVAHKEDPEQEAHVVDEVFSKGYRVGGNLIREAVVVTRG